MLKKVTCALAALALSATPALAAQNPAASLSIAKSVRASSSASHDSKLAGGGGFFVAAIAVIAVIVGVIIVANSDDKPASH